MSQEIRPNLYLVIIGLLVYNLKNGVKKLYLSKNFTFSRILFKFVLLLLALELLALIIDDKQKKLQLK